MSRRINWFDIKKALEAIKIGYTGEELEYILDNFKWLEEIKVYCEKIIIEDTDTVLIKFSDLHDYTRSDINKIIELIASTHPDEVEVTEDGWLRLW